MNLFILFSKYESWPGNGEKGNFGWDAMFGLERAVNSGLLITVDIGFHQPLTLIGRDRSFGNISGDFPTASFPGYPGHNGGDRLEQHPDDNTRRDTHESDDAIV